MDIQVKFDQLDVGRFYDRNFLTDLWGYKGREAISKGVITPAGHDCIILFVTKEKQKSSTQYIDYINEGFLYWEGEAKGLNNNRIINSKKNREPIYLFYRYRHHADFEYLGLVELVYFIPQEKAPFKFIFQFSLSEKSNDNVVNEPARLYFTPKNTERESLRLSRIGQGKYRMDLLDLWQGCALTDVDVPEILRASHIKPWKDSTNSERLDPYNGLILTPTLDLLFDKGFISFKDSGNIILSDEIQPYCKTLGLKGDMNLKKHFDNNNIYLEYHRDEIYQKRFKSGLL